MTDATFFPSDEPLEQSAPGGEAPRRPPPVKPPWLRSSALAAVVIAHGLVAVALMATAVQTYSPLDSTSMDLIPEGDYFEQQEQAEADDTPPPEAVEEPELVAPPPLVVNPDAPKLAVKKDDTEKKIIKKREEKREVERAKEKREAVMHRRMGMQGGREGASMSAAAYGGLLARAIRTHTPGSSSAGPGAAYCSFHVSSGGGLTGISCSGKHASLAHRIIASVHAPPPPSGIQRFFSQSFNFR